MEDLANPGPPLPMVVCFSRHTTVGPPRVFVEIFGWNEGAGIFVMIGNCLAGWKQMPQGRRIVMEEFRGKLDAVTGEYILFVALALWSFTLWSSTNQAEQAQVLVEPKPLSSKTAMRRRLRSVGTTYKEITIKPLAPIVRYETNPSPAGTGVGKAYHLVRTHPRRLKSGKIVMVRAHHRGDKDRGIIQKTYNVDLSANA